MLVVGVVGEKGSGKETFIKLASQSVRSEKRETILAHHRFSDPLREALELLHIEKTRENLQTLPKILKENYGKTALVDAVYYRALKSGADIVFLDGLRWPEDPLMVRKFEKNIIVYVTASPRIRYQRLETRGENVGEKGLSWQQFLKEEAALSESFIAEIGKKADVKIINESTEQKLQEAADQFVGKHILAL